MHVKGTLDVHHALLASDVPHEIIRLRRSVLAVEELPDALGVPASHCLAVRVLEADDRIVALLLPVLAQVDLEAVRRVLGADGVRSASGLLVNERTDYAARLVPPLPLPVDVALLAESAVSRLDVIYTATGESGTALGIRADLLVRAAGARCVRVAVARERVPAPAA